MKRSWVMSASLWLVMVHTNVISNRSKRMNVPHVYAAVLAGGSGQRLWPLSRAQKPKQFLRIQGKKTLLEQTVDRIRPSVASCEHVYVVTSSRYQESIQKYLHGEQLIVEPAARNTAPAILYTCFKLQNIDPDAIVVFLPADAFIPQQEYSLFTKYVQKALSLVAKKDVIALLGVRPTHPATGYGYIECNQDNHEDELFKVVRFHEKPNLETAQSYIKQENMLWNIGMFCAKAHVFLDECKKYTPELYLQMEQFMEGHIPYDAIQDISIDYALMEKSACTWVLPVDFEWCDVGNVSVFLKLVEKYGSQEKKLVSVEAKNNLIDVPGKLVAMVGVEDLCVVQTDDALLITRIDEAEKVRGVVTKLKSIKELSEYI